MRTVLFQNFKRKMSEAVTGRCSSNSVLDFDNKLMKGTKNFCKFIEDISKGVRFYEAAALQPICLLKKKNSPSEENFNDYAKILITHILY